MSGVVVLPFNFILSFKYLSIPSTIAFAIFSWYLSSCNLSDSALFEINPASKSDEVISLSLKPAIFAFLTPLLNAPVSFIAFSCILSLKGLWGDLSLW